MVTREEGDGVVVVAIPRTMTPEGMGELVEALGLSPRRAFVLTGTGSAFCLGADLKWLGAEADAGEAVGRLVARHHDVVRAMRAVAVPVVTAINGAAAGGGMSLALAGDYCLAASQATFTAAYFRLGLTPDGGNSLFLRRLVGPAKAMELLLRNNTLTAVEARELGLVGEVVAGEALLDRAVELLAGFAAVPAETLRTTRRLLDGGLEEQLRAEAAAVTAAARRPEFAAALRGFLERSGR